VPDKHSLSENIDIPESVTVSVWSLTPVQRPSTVDIPVSPQGRTYKGTRKTFERSNNDTETSPTMNDEYDKFVDSRKERGLREGEKEEQRRRGSGDG